MSKEQELKAKKIIKCIHNLDKTLGCGYCVYEEMMEITVIFDFEDENSKVKILNVERSRTQSAPTP